MTEAKAAAIYDILVEKGGATRMMQDSFIWHHTKQDCDEWRFGGHFGFGGKYRSRTNTVDCYQEDETPERLKLIKQINSDLSKIS